MKKLLLFLVLINPLHNVFAVLSQDFIYYDIGGANATLDPYADYPPNTILGFRGRFGVSYSCGKFKFLNEFTHQFTNLSGKIMETMQMAISATMASLPSYILQKLDPGLHQLYKSYSLQINNTFDKMKKKCREYEAAYAKGESPFSIWSGYADAFSWNKATASGGAISNANDSIETKKENNKKTFQWINGVEAGNTNVPGGKEVRVNNDVAIAGYNYSINRDPADTAPAPPSVGGTPYVAGSYIPAKKTNLLTDTWSTPIQFGKWVTDVVGETILDGDKPQTMTGKGLLPELKKSNIKYERALNDAVMRNNSLPATTKKTLFDNQNMPLTNGVIDSIKEIGNQKLRTLYIAKLSSELALKETVERALIARRTLLIGSKEPYVSASPAADQIINKTVPELEKEIEILMFESRIRKELTSNTMKSLLNNEIRKKTGNTLTPAINNYKWRVEDGFQHAN